jgi:putative multicomponent Na+:H+ antiporter subunit B
VNSSESYIVAITALMPLAAMMVVSQVNPYHALIVRGVLGAIAALVYTVLGAADVALTEALVGTLLAITLYAVAVRSSMILRLGVLDGEAPSQNEPSIPPAAKDFQEFMTAVKTVFSPWHLRVELVSYADPADLHQALLNKDIHATCVRSHTVDSRDRKAYHTTVRLRRLYDIMQSELIHPLTELTYLSPAKTEEAHG